MRRGCVRPQRSRRPGQGNDPARDEHVGAPEIASARCTSCSTGTTAPVAATWMCSNTSSALSGESPPKARREEQVGIRSFVSPGAAARRPKVSPPSDAGALQARRS
jgi:hypothetical protein